jgi:drug/metabolite transporter (DMT)-like permease
VSDTSHDSIAGRSAHGIAPYLWILLAALAFSVMGSAAHSLKEESDWRVIALARAVIPLCLTIVWGLYVRGPLLVWRPMSLWVRSLAGSTALLCTFYSFSRLPVGDVLTLTNLFPIWLALLSWPVLGIVPRWSTWIAIAIGMAGVALIQQPHVAAGNSATAVAVFSSFCSAVAMLGLHRLTMLSPRTVVMHFSAVSLVFCLAAWLVSPLRAVDLLPDLSIIPTLLTVGVSATLGQFALTKAFTLGDPAKVSVAGLTQVAFGLAFDRWLWQRELTLVHLLGTALVIAPTAWLLWMGPVVKEPPAGPESVG